LRTLVPSALAVTATAVVGGLASRSAQSTWYATLKKPPYQPPRQAFPVVWPILSSDSQRQLVLVVLQPAHARYLRDRGSRVDRQQCGSDQAFGRRAGRQGSPARGLSRLVRVRHAVFTHIWALNPPVDMRGRGCTGVTVT
jgi:hypothetical protein